MFNLNAGELLSYYKYVAQIRPLNEVEVFFFGSGATAIFYAYTAKCGSTGEPVSGIQIQPFFKKGV